MNSDRSSARDRANRFCQRFGLRIPILEAPMAGACPPSLAAAVANAGGMGALGAVTTRPDGILEWAKEYRAQSNGSFQINLWIPDPAPARDQSAELRVREFLSQWGPSVPPEWLGYDRFWRKADVRRADDFHQQPIADLDCEA